MSRIPEFFRVTHQGPYKHVTLCNHHLGLFDEPEAKDLAKQLRRAANELDPANGDASMIPPTLLKDPALSTKHSPEEPTP